MTGPDARSAILAFAAHVGRAHLQPPEVTARHRNWLTEDGEVTEDGLSLVRALAEQAETRTVFRGNF
ncbi:hypothetical protein N8I71_10030 [Roseibacterium sp. SDUM158016]|uniref:hypothetical protein n=1 Tax=Roseicyclus sediminis TaxID=2980997 RepID=UPI0021D3EA77|nr:hypothetical protein [Roseibacterium sp. SDUM158016]MCU4653171.1 hypothetical protein [Roseibacterium sp. SDUM158016]